MSADELELKLAWIQHLGDGPAALDWFDSVAARHREPARHYHTLRHVAWVVRHVSAMAGRGLVDDVGAVVAAAFFHDAVYDPRRHDNEDASAALARRALGELRWPADRIDHASAMITATAGHLVDAADRDTAALLAADLAVLASEPAKYGDYVRNVRREYRHVDDAAWVEGRGALLRRLLARDHLYAPTLGLDDWERRARANMAAELAALDHRPAQ